MAGTKKRLFSTITAGILIVTMLLASAGCGTDQDRSSASATAESAETAGKALNYREADYTLRDRGGDTITLINNYDGFSVKLPADYKNGIDVSAVATDAGNGSEEVSIFFEQFKKEEDFTTYRGYSNKPVLNSDAYTVTQEEKKTKESDRIVYSLAWNRSNLDNVQDDKPYYRCIDILYLDQTIPESEGQYLDYTLYFRSAEPMDQERIDDICSSFKLTDRKDHSLTDKPENASQDLTLRSWWADSTKEFYTSHFSRDAALDWGLFNNPYWTQGADTEDVKTLAELESEAGYRFDVLVRYCHFSEDGLTEETESDMDMAAAQDRYLELTLQTGTSDKGTEIYDLLDGKFDDYIRQMAAAIRSRQRPVLFRLCNEMNGDWCGYSAYNYGRDTELFIEMYKYVYDKFTEYGAQPYTIWVWNPNEQSKPSYRWNSEYRYYPGDDYVDVVGLTGYNTGTYYDGETWRTFDEIYRTPYLQDVVNYSQPLMITEFACSSVGGNKAKWMRDMFKTIRAYDRIKIAVWWNGRDLDGDGNVARPYWFDETNDTEKAFREGVTAVETDSGSSGSSASAG